MWFIYALLSAIFAALVAIFGKVGVKNLDSTLATTIRSIIMTSFLILVTLSLGKFSNFKLNQLTGKEWIYIVLAGMAGATSWIFYFLSLKYGFASQVAAIDRLSIVFVVILAALFLKEGFHWQTFLGAFLMIAGALLISRK